MAEENESMPEKARETRWSALIFLLVWLLSAVYLGAVLNKGWYPHDEGTYGQSAERVLNGEMPHRDFGTGYTGGLDYVDAFIFRLFGINTVWLRIFLYIVFLAWVPAIYALAREFLRPWPAAGVTLVSVAWSVPNYTAASPNWFCLFLATFGTLALARYIRRPAIHRLVFAGLCGGFSFLVKSTALYYVAASLLFFVYREQSASRDPRLVPQRTFSYLAFLTLCLSIFVLALIKLIFPAGAMPGYLHFVLPGSAIATTLLVRERVPPAVGSLARFKILFTMAVPFLLGVAVPFLLYCAFYWQQGALHILMNQLFVVIFRQISHLHLEAPGLILEFPSVLAVLFIAEVAQLEGGPRRFLSVFLTIAATIVLIGSRSSDIGYVVAVKSASGLVPVLALIASVILSRSNHDSQSHSQDDQQLALLFFMAALLSLIQFPYAHLVYFVYTAPIVALFAACMASRFARPPRLVLLGAVAFYVLFGVFVLRFHLLDIGRHTDFESTRLALPRANLWVSREDARTYGELIPFVKNLAGDDPIIAGPDCPEVYFLAGIKNPTPVLFDHLSDSYEYRRDMKSVLDRPNFVRVAVLNNAPHFSVDQWYVLQPLIVGRFPRSQNFGNFTVYWRP